MEAVRKIVSAERITPVIDWPWRDICCISEVTVLELRYGAENSNHPQKHHQAVDL